jgi:hypothetical protein
MNERTKLDDGHTVIFYPGRASPWSCRTPLLERTAKMELHTRLDVQESVLATVGKVFTKSPTAIKLTVSRTVAMMCKEAPVKLPPVKAPVLIQALAMVNQTIP